MCFHYANLNEKKDWIFPLHWLLTVQPDWGFTKGCCCFGGCSWQLALIWMGKAMCWHQRSSKNSLRKFFGFSKGIAWSCSPVPSDFNNHQIASEKLNPSISTNPLEGNEFREISTEANEPSSSCMACENSWRHWQKIHSCFRKDKKKGQSSQILTSNYSPCRRNTNSIQAAIKSFTFTGSEGSRRGPEHLQDSW